MVEKRVEGLNKEVAEGGDRVKVLLVRLRRYNVAKVSWVIKFEIRNQICTINFQAAYLINENSAFNEYPI